MLRRIFEPTKEGVTGKWRKVHPEELCDMSYSPNIILVMKSRMRCAGHASCMGHSRGTYKDLGGDLTDRGNFEDLDVDGRIILQRIFKKWDGGRDWIDLARYRDRWRALVNAVINLQF
jgi:hypothetical protein